jgi:transposase
VLTCVGWSRRLAAISRTVVSPRSASSATATLNWSDKFRRFVVLVSILSCWIHLSTLSNFAGPLQNTKLHAICESQGRPLNLFVTAGQVSDYVRARALLSSLPNVDWLRGDRGHDADWFTELLRDRGISPCIPGRKQRKVTVKYDKRRCKRRNRFEIMFGRLKDWRRVAIRYDRCP